MEKRFPYLKGFGFLTILVSIAIVSVFQLFHNQLVKWVELTLSPDKNLSQFGVEQLSATFYFGSAMLLAIGVVIVKANSKLWRKNMIAILFKEPLFRTDTTKLTPKLVFFISSVSGLLLTASMKLSPRLPDVFQFLYAKDKGLLDILVPFTYIVSAVLMLITIRRIWKDPKLLKIRKAIVLIYSFFTSLLIAYAGEETSWGQDIFRWKTPALFSGNIESETNLHNYFNPIFPYLYTALSIILLIVVLSIWLEYNHRWLRIKRLFFPHPSLIGLSLIIAYFAIVSPQEEELIEELIAVFILLYTLRIFNCFRSPNLRIDGPE